MKEKYKAVLYLRLSKEDKDKLTKGDDSASIRNQRLLLMNYAMEQGYPVTEVYSDDDESGLFDTRPGFEKMITDAKAGKFNLVIAKSQSRFSRNMEHVEKYLHRDFPNLGIRFIGVADGADTWNAENKKSRQINGLVNEWYCEDLSRNIRSVFRAKMKDGQYLGASCPYGYIKDPKDRHHLVVDAFAAGIVKRIYDLYLKGYGKAKIAKILTEDGILIPARYKREILGINYHNAHELKTTKSWSYQTVHMILNNEVYTGMMVQNKCKHLSYKDQRHVKQPESEWIRAAGMHEPIIAWDTFKAVQERQKIRTKEVRKRGADSVFAGVLFCAECGHAMVRMYERRGNHKFIGYCCKTYKTQGKEQCSRHAVDDGRLQETVLRSLRREAGKILTPEDIRSLSRIQDTDDADKSCRMQASHMEKEIKRREEYKKKTYQSYLEDVISREEYMSYAEGFETEIHSLKENLEHLKERQKEKDRKASENEEWAERFRDYINVDRLTREMVLELIDRIEVNGDGSVDICYKFRTGSVSPEGVNQKITLEAAEMNG